MYKFIYYYLFLQAKKKNNNADIMAAIYTVVIAWIHILCIAAIIKRLTGFSIIYYPPCIASLSYGVQKYTLLPFALAICYFVGKYFIKHHKQIEKKYEGVNMLTWKNLVLVLLASIGVITLICIIVPKA